MRKQASLEPADAIVLTIETDAAGRSAIEANESLLTKTVGASELRFAETSGEEVQAAEYSFIFAIEKV